MSTFLSHALPVDHAWTTGLQDRQLVPGARHVVPLVVLLSFMQDVKNPLWTHYLINWQKQICIYICCAAAAIAVPPLFRYAREWCIRKLIGHEPLFSLMKNEGDSGLPGGCCSFMLSM